MHTEFSAVTMIAATLLLLAALLGVLAWGNFSGRDIAEMGYRYISESETHSINETVMELERRQDQALPSAAVYRILKENCQVVQSTCSVCGKTLFGLETGDCIKSHMHGRLKVNLIDNGDGSYAVVLSN